MRWILLLLLLFAPLAQAQCGGNTVVMHAPAVAKTSTGELTGVVTEFIITVSPGGGHVYIETWPLAQVDMQASARLAAQVAGRVLGVNMSNYDVFVQVRANTTIIGGPSAGGTMTVGIIAALMGWEVNPRVMMTGMINPDGSIGPVGGVLEKLEAAERAGARIFLIPRGQRIQLTDNGTVDLVEVGRALGVEVIEVRDVYEAVYYFTGRKLPRPRVPENVVIDTSFLREDALRDHNATVAFYRSVLAEKGPSETLLTAARLINESATYIERGLYYTALSKDFQARILIRQVAWYEPREEFFRLTNETIREAEETVEGQTIRGVTMLQAIAAAEERVEDAKASLLEATYLLPTDPWNAAWALAYAYERAKTAIFWTDLGKRFAKGEPIDRALVARTAREYIAESELIVAYIESMYGTGGYLTDTIDRAQAYYEAGKYSAALFTAMQARVQAEVFLHTLAIDNWTVLIDKLEMLKGDAKTAIGLAEERGITPILAMAYYEFAQSFEELAKENKTLEDLQTAMTFYTYAKETATLFLPVEKKELVQPVQVYTPQYEAETPSLSPVPLVILSFVAGLALGTRIRR